MLREVATIACEDTRQTQKLLNHYKIKKPLLSYHEHNEQSRTAELIESLERGDTIALVSDAGMPLISDPGYRLVAAAIDKGIDVVPVPGPSAALTALPASGLPVDEFRFIGFLPAKASARRKLLENLAAEPATLVAYESPHRILDTVADLAAISPNRPLALARELTKVHEEFLRGSAQQILDQLQARSGAVKGEITLVIGPANEQKTNPVDPVEEVLRVEKEAGLDRMEAIKIVARQSGRPKREIYRLVSERLVAERGSNPAGKRRT